MGPRTRRDPFYTPLGYSGEIDANSGEIDATTPDSYSATDSAMAVAPRPPALC